MIFLRDSHDKERTMLYLVNAIASDTEVVCVHSAIARGGKEHIQDFQEDCYTIACLYWSCGAVD